MLDLFFPVCAQIWVGEAEAFCANPFYFLQEPVKTVEKPVVQSDDEDE